ncbi:mechanosensitive ion channel family protein [Amphibacillus indicireducens]|uniref:Small-conductance mechanosensitive channel protein MscT n=1 Tax=Amphibacillus indicireducens TaxID=1076330 RepID=A0ABP7VPM8_9BACI
MSINFSTIIEVVIGTGLKIILLVAAYLITRTLGNKIISNVLQKATQRQKLSKARLVTLEKLILNIFSYLLIFIFITMLFGIFEVPIGPLIASAGVIGLAIGFGAQGLVSDVVTGFFILLEKQIEVGEYITVANYDGIVEEIGLRTTQIRSFDGTLNFIPNRQIESVANHSRGTMRALVDIHINYESDLDQTLEILNLVCQEFQSDERFVDGPNVIGVNELGATNMTIRIVGQTVNMEQWSAERDIRKAVKLALNTDRIKYPYPQQITRLIDDHKDD